MKDVYEQEIGQVIDEVMIQASSKDNVAGLYTVGTDKLSTEVYMEDGQKLKDDLGIERIDIRSTLNPDDAEKPYIVDEVTIYAGAKLLNQEGFDKIDIPSQNGILTARVHIIDGEFIATVDSSCLFNKNISIDESADSSKFKDMTMMRGNISLSDFSEDELIEKLDNLVSNGIKIQVASEMGFDLGDIETEKLKIVQDRIQEILTGHVVYNISFGDDYSVGEFTERIKEVGTDLSQINPNKDTPARLNIKGNLLKDKEYFTIQGVLVNSKCGPSIKDLMSVFNNITLTDKNSRQVDIRARRF